MRIDPVPVNTEKYASRAYLIRGDFNKLEDINALVDTGADQSAADFIETINTGAGKKKLDLIVLTHCHFDHTGGVKELKKRFGTPVAAMSGEIYVDRILKNGDILKLGDRNFEVIHCPEHSNDSVLLYNWDKKILFSGDTNFDFKSSDFTLGKRFVEVFERLMELGVDVLYPGHGSKIENFQSVMKRSYDFIKKATVI